MKPTRLQRLLAHIEKPIQPYTGSGETALAVAILPLAFVYKLLDCLYGRQPIPGQPWLYMVLLSAFTAAAFSSVFFLATPIGERWIKRMLENKRAYRLAALPILYIGFFLLILWLLDLPQLHTHALAMIASPWAQLPLPLFLFLAALFLVAGLSAGLRLIGPTAQSFSLRQLGGVLLATMPYLLLQEQLPLLWCFTTPVALLVLVYGTGLGREYFGYSLVPRSWQEALGVSLLLVGGLLLFLLTTLWAGTITYTGGLWHTSFVTLYDSVFVWLLIVGISEEVIFRCGVLTLIAALLANKTPSTWWSNHPRLSAVLITSALFALSHLFRGATLFFLSFLASLLYGFAFVAGKSLFGPVLLHGLLNVLVLMNFHLSDFK